MTEERAVQVQEPTAGLMWLVFYDDGPPMPVTRLDQVDRDHAFRIDGPFVPLSVAEKLAAALEQAIVDMNGLAGDADPDVAEFVRVTALPRARAALAESGLLRPAGEHRREDTE